MTMKKWKSLLSVFCLLLLVSCAPKEQGGQQLDYEQTKKMVVDILKTDDGKKAIEEIMADEKFKQTLVMDQAIVAQSIEQALTSEKGVEFWKKAFEDPKFVEAFAKSMQVEHEKLIKNLMKDPEYQAMMIDILKNPEIEKEVATLLKSQEYRKYLQTVVSETFESPLYQAKLLDLFIKAAEEAQKGTEKEKESGGGGGQD